jgi:polysaccharide export outer membrane protein
MRLARNAAVAASTLLLMGCQASPGRLAGPPPVAPAAFDYWEQDEAYLQARAVAARGAPSSTPELDAIAALASATTPELTLHDVLEPADRPTPAAVLRPGDRVQIEVFGHDGLGGERCLGPDGRVPMLVLGPLRLGGLTEAEAARTVAEAMSALARRPQVQVRLLEAAPAHVRVVGRVASGSGSVQLPPERALDCLDLIAHRGGLADDAADGRLTLLRGEDGRTRGYHFSYADVLAARPAGLVLPLRPDDVLVVPRLPEVYVFGQVAQSGALPLRPGATIASLLVQAGGLTEEASARDVQVLRGEQRLEVQGLERALEPGDVVFVPQRRRVYLVGEGLASSGPIDLPATGLTVVQAIAAVGWLTKHADVDGVEVLRYRGGEGSRVPIPLREILAGEVRDADFPLLPGDVIHVPESVW